MGILDSSSASSKAVLYPPSKVDNTLLLTNGLFSSSTKSVNGLSLYEAFPFALFLLGWLSSYYLGIF